MSVAAASDSSSSSELNNNDSSICDYTRMCGPNGNCDLDEAQTCVCLDGFTPKSPTDFAYLNFRQGCVRNKALNCSTDVFVRHSSFKEPSGGYSLSNQQDCLGKCKSDCSCMAYKVIVGGCKLWNGDLFDVRLLKQGGQDLYIRMSASEEQGESEAGGKKQGRNEGMVVGIVVGSSVVISMIIIASWYMFRERTASKALEHVRINEIVTHDTNVQILQMEDMGLPLFDLSRIIVATDNFSPINKLGEGGFGSVYKGILNDGQQIAVKRLSSSSGQGLNEFKTEVKLIAKLQHRNLVKLFGCCIQEEEKLLIYEYMPNKSLDYFIFG
nr:G-type lectin S-receptor-like serine/threonine-protein kinase SD1-1 [Arachis hypogaea]